jgi:hypothetical protein
MVIVLTPQEVELAIELQGNLAAMLKAAQKQSSGASLAPLERWGDERSPGDDDRCVMRSVTVTSVRAPRT